MAVKIDGNSLDWSKFRALAEGEKISLAPSVSKNVQKARSIVKNAAAGDVPVYGINTGFGYFAKVKIAKEQRKVLQKHILESHAAGFGPSLSEKEIKVAMALRINSLARGYSGVRFELIDWLAKLINHKIYPVVPQYGSVGASGDLAPLAHLSLPIIGKGKVFYKGALMPASKALKLAKMNPLILEEKEGLALINGTEFMLAMGGLSFLDALGLLELADLTAALTMEAMLGCKDALEPEIHRVRNQSGQILSSQTMRRFLQGSFLYSKSFQPPRVQDPYSLRCAPQVHGASRDALKFVGDILEKELNASTDNPLVFFDKKRILSGGNFHGQPLALAMDFAAIALSELANISDRRLELLCNPQMSRLPAFLSPKEGLQSGYMALQYLSASLVSENKILAHPASIDSIPGNCGIEDHVSMGMTSAIKLKKIVSNVKTVLAIESLAAAQAIDLRGSFKLGKGTGKWYQTLRSVIAPLKEDRIVAEDVEKAAQVVDEFLGEI